MKKGISILALLFICILGFAQYPLQLYPKTTPLNFSVEGELEFNRLVARCDTFFMWSDVYCSEVAAGYWETEGGACSWYCNGGPDTVMASSYLAAYDTISYLPKNAHNWSYKTAWAEGVPGHGIGEYLLFSFPADKPRVGTIKIANGYVKSQKDWENNSRVKTIKLYLNDKVYAILHLEDSRSLQVFSVTPIGNAMDTWEQVKDDPNWTLKFEIVAVYPGKKYQDTVISEISFDGPDSHSTSAEWRNY